MFRHLAKKLDLQLTDRHHLVSKSEIVFWKCNQTDVHAVPQLCTVTMSPLFSCVTVTFACHIECRFAGLLCATVGSVDRPMYENVEVQGSRKRRRVESKPVILNCRCCCVRPNLLCFFTFT